MGLWGGGARIPNASFYSNMWFIGLQGIKVNKGRKTKSFTCSPLTPTPQRPGTESPSGRSCWDLRETLSKLNGKFRKTSGFWFQPGLGQSPWDKEKLPFLFPVPHHLSSYGPSTRVVVPTAQEVGGWSVSPGGSSLLFPILLAPPVRKASGSWECCRP